MCLISPSAALGPALGGWARDALGGFSSVFLLCGLAALLMLGIIAFMRPPVFAGSGRAAAADREPLASAHEPW